MRIIPFSYFINRHHNLRQNHTANYIPSFNRRKNTSKACPIVRQTCQKSSVIKLSTVFSSKMHWKRVRIVSVRYNGDSFHWFWQPWVTPLLLRLPLVPAELLLRLKSPAMNPVPKTNWWKDIRKVGWKIIFIFRLVRKYRRCCTRSFKNSVNLENFARADNKCISFLFSFFSFLKNFWYNVGVYFIILWVDEILLHLLEYILVLGLIQIYLFIMNVIKYRSIKYY